MELNYLINKIFTDLVITLSYNFNISTQAIGAISFLVAMYAFLDIFAGSGISEYRMGYWFYAYLKKVPKFLPSSADVLLAVVFGLASLRIMFLPAVKGANIYSNQNLGLQIEIPANWEVVEDKTYLSDINTQRTQEDVYFGVKSKDFEFTNPTIYLARYSSPFQPPSDYKQIISNSNSNDFVYSKTAGKSLFTEERIILKNVNSKQLIIYANSDSILIDRIISSIKFY